MPGLGRIHVEDERDKEFSLRSILAVPPTRAYRYWNTSGWWGDQGDTPQCVAYAWTHFIEDGPVTIKTENVPFEEPSSLYHAAQLVDEFPGENYEGTSVRAGAKVLKSKGYIDSYYWAWDLPTVQHALLTRGPVVVGTNWHEGMFYPDSKGIIRLAGGVAGGHAYVLDGINMKTELIRIKNSWGRSWGRKGFAYIDFHDLAVLLGDNGEACLAQEAEHEVQK